MSNSPNKCFSQNGEDYLLWKFFAPSEKGFYIDVGAFDGIHLSNSYIFDLAGWDGICIEANPFYYNKCKENRPTSTCIQAACTDNTNDSSITFYTEELGLLSGTKKWDEDEIKKRYENRGLTFNGFKEVTVPTVTLDSILQKMPSATDIDFISIDVEGSEMAVLHGLNISTYKPKIIVIEANTKESEKLLDAYLIGSFGYHKARRLSENIFYCRDKNDANRFANITINYTPENNDHPLGDSYNPPKKPLHTNHNLYGKLKNIIKRLVR